MKKTRQNRTLAAFSAVEPHVVDVVIAQNGLRLKRAPLLVAGRNVDVGASGGFPLGQRARAALNGMFGG